MMAAACRGKGRRGLSKEVACEFMGADRGKVAKMPEKKGRRGKRG